jgi:hypothetical protein
LYFLILRYGLKNPHGEQLRRGVFGSSRLDTCYPRAATNPFAIFLDSVASSLLGVDDADFISSFGF